MTLVLTVQIDIIMRKEARDGEGRVMAEDELRDELSTCEYFSPLLRLNMFRSIDISILRFQSCSQAQIPRGEFRDGETISSIQFRRRRADLALSPI